MASLPASRRGIATLEKYGREHFASISALGKARPVDPEVAETRAARGGLVRARRTLLAHAIERGDYTRDEADAIMLRDFGLLMEPTRSRMILRQRASELGLLAVLPF